MIIGLEAAEMREDQCKYYHMAVPLGGGFEVEIIAVCESSKEAPRHKGRSIGEGCWPIATSREVPRGEGGVKFLNGLEKGNRAGSKVLTTAKLKMWDSMSYRLFRKILFGAAESWYYSVLHRTFIIIYGMYKSPLRFKF